MPLPLAMTRREALLLAVAAAGAAAVPSAAPAQPASLLARPIPRSGELLPVVGLGTAVNFDVAEDAAKRAALAGVLRALAAGGGKLIDTASSYGNAELVLGGLIAEAGLRPRLFLATKLETRELASGPSALDGALRRLRTERLRPDDAAQCLAR